jgi:RNA polymerase sigma factor (TIGR02999 family)
MVMSRVTLLVQAIEQGDPHAAKELLPLVYDELRRLAAAQLGHEAPGQTLDATALVHEAYVRLVGEATQVDFANRRHFFAAAAQAMRRILVENARRKRAAKRGGHLKREVLDPDQVPAAAVSEDILALEEALAKLAAAEPQVAELVQLRYFAGLSIPQVADVLSVSPRTADTWWAYARAWLLAELRDGGDR